MKSRTSPYTNSTVSRASVPDSCVLWEVINGPIVDHDPWQRPIKTKQLKLGRKRLSYLANVYFGVTKDHG